MDVQGDGQIGLLVALAITLDGAAHSGPVRQTGSIVNQSLNLPPLGDGHNHSAGRRVLELTASAAFAALTGGRQGEASRPEQAALSGKRNNAGSLVVLSARAVAPRANVSATGPRRAANNLPRSFWPEQRADEGSPG